MGKIRTRLIGLEEVEKKQKEEQRRRAEEKKSSKKAARDHKIRAPGLKGGERMVQLEVEQEELAKMEKAKEILKAQISKKEEKEQKEVKRKTAVKKRVRGKNYLIAKKEIKKYFDKFKSQESVVRSADSTAPLSRSKRTSQTKVRAQNNRSQPLSLQEAIKLLKKIKYAKFDESVELHLNVDEVGLRGTVEFPNSIGKTLRVRVVDETVLTQIEKGRLDFDVLITHPQYMPKLAKFAKVLGPKGLMPNPKAGTISQNPQEVAKKYSSGVFRWKTESKAPLVHQMIGKISFEEKKLVENARAFIASVGPSHIQKIFIKTTMSPSIRVELNRV